MERSPEETMAPGAEAPPSPARRRFLRGPFTVEEKVLAEPAPTPLVDARAETLKAAVAEAVRKNAQVHPFLTPGPTIAALMSGLTQDRMSALLAEMAAEEGYADIKAVATAAGHVYFYSERHLAADAAAARSLVEDGKLAIAEKVRADSRDKVALTAVGAFPPLCPGTPPEGVAAILADLAVDARHADVRSVTARDGSVHYHSDLYLSGNYALILVRAMANDPCAAIAETVRDAARIFPRPTPCELFRHGAFGLNAGRLDALVGETLAKPEFADIQRMVHPATGAVYLYSSRHMTQVQAWSIMDWEEVGHAANP